MQQLLAQGVAAASQAARPVEATHTWYRDVEGFSDLP